MAKQKTATKKQRELIAMLREQFERREVQFLKVNLEPFVTTGMEFLFTEEKLANYREIRPHKRHKVEATITLSDKLFDQIKEKVGDYEDIS